MSEMIERVARAIAPTMFDPYNVRWYWELWAEQGQKDARVIARKAIEAMREPTKEMLLKGNEVAANHIEAGVDSAFGPFSDVDPALALSVLGAMIDAALKD